MENKSHQVVEETARRRKPIAQFPEDVEEFLLQVVQTIQDRDLSVNAKTIKQWAVNLGYATLTPDGFIQMIWPYIGGKGDIEAWCVYLGIETESEGEEDADETV